MIFMPTTKVDLYRDADETDENVFGTEIETGTAPLAVGIPAAVSSRIVTRQTSVDSTAPMRVEVFTVRVLASYGVREGDRLKDQKTGQTYLVNTIPTAPTLIGVPSARLECSRVGIGR